MRVDRSCDARFANRRARKVTGEILRLPLVAQDDDPDRVVEVQKCGDQRASRRFVFNELRHFLIADSWRSCRGLIPQARLTVDLGGPFRSRTA